MELTNATIVQVPSVLNPETVRNLRRALTSAITERSSSVVVMMGEGRVFCRGLEVSVSSVEEDARTPIEDFAGCLETIRMGHKPVIGLVQGAAAGGGVGLAAACDGVLATTEASFTLPELLLGLTPAVIFPYLAQRVTLQKLRWMGLTVGAITGQQAVELGLADAVCTAEKAPSVLRSWIKKLHRIEPQVVAAWKRMTIQAALPGSNAGVEITLERLRDANVREHLRTYADTGWPPWLEKE